MKRLLLTLMLVACTQDASRRSADSEKAPYCKSAQRVSALPASLREASGLAVSRAHPGILWLHNDSGEPYLFAVDTLGNVRARIAVDVRNDDWEDIAVGPCPQGNCLYIGAIGDNRQNRADRQIYRLPEPSLDAQLAHVHERFRYRLPGAARDVEALFVMPDERMYLISKGRSGPITLYRFPLPADSAAVNDLEAIQELTTGLVQLPDMVTGAGATPDGRVVVIRTYGALQLYELDDNGLKPLLPGTGFDLQPLREHQGEGVDIRADGTVFLVSEKGMETTDPPLSRVQCVWSTR
ncbi:MAG TPA: hypothetical protein VFO52_02320 [Longimicrobiales bacterium]|nr:hypothetical protein [Longimicrobiales bacterium]